MAFKAIFKKAFHFTKDRIEPRPNPWNGNQAENQRIVEAEVRVKPGLQPQVVEDWVKDTVLYKNGLTDRTIVEA